MRQTAQLLAGIALLIACSAEPSPTEATADVQMRAASGRRDLAEDLAALRRATARFHQFNRAAVAGWSAQITPCMADAAGGMGFHYGNVGLIDGSVRVEEPELLLYEPTRNGRLRLVAVEYIIPYSAHSRSAAPPVLFGQEFTQNDAFQLWGLHAWVWKRNPRGLFANWNPRVTCLYAPAASAMAHP